MALLGVIPARAGSKRLPGKNVMQLGGMPLLAHTIHAARDAQCLARVIVSTDDRSIALLATGYGAEAPWLRSPELATDEADVVGAVLEVLNRLAEAGEAEPDGVMLLQPTSPFRSPGTIRRAAELFERSGGESVVSIGPARTHPYWTVAIEADGRIRPFVAGVEKAPRAQDLPPAFELNGLVYVATPATLRTGSFYSERTVGLVVADPRESLDIDTPMDWLVAQALLPHPPAEFE